MNTLTAGALLHCFLFAVLVRSAPVGPASEPPVAFREAAERAKTLVEKIHEPLPCTLPPSPQRDTKPCGLMVTSLGIPAARSQTSCPGASFWDMCESCDGRRSQLYQGLEFVWRLRRTEGLPAAGPQGLLTHINKMKEAAQVGLAAVRMTRGWIWPPVSIATRGSGGGSLALAHSSAPSATT
ncbi:granulocyte colony-stimulating factor-like protein [Lates japonicus]|uniref:Granulocyte colony-stimulating factor-like protein n=1 Tax=Lates japonicus TaxID=270547 RepID=A0AAD3RHR1_LATJO|nr:granulocyte colony-stimulating factor-like protein [Lates japonicus]